jgi:hypothetical protein
VKLVKSEKSQLSIAANSSDFILLLSCSFQCFWSALFFSALLFLSSQLFEIVIALFHVWVSPSFLPCCSSLKKKIVIHALFRKHTQGTTLASWEGNCKLAA